MIRTVVVATLLFLLAAEGHCMVVAAEEVVRENVEWFWDRDTFIINLTGTVMASTENLPLTPGWLFNRGDPRFTHSTRLAPADLGEYLRALHGMVGDGLFPRGAWGLVESLRNQPSNTLILRAAYRTSSHLIAFKAEAQGKRIVRLVLFVDGPLEDSMALLPKPASPPWFRVAVVCRFDAGKYGGHAGNAFLYSLQDLSGLPVGVRAIPGKDTDSSREEATGKPPDKSNAAPSPVRQLQGTTAKPESEAARVPTEDTKETTATETTVGEAPALATAPDEAEVSPLSGGTAWFCLVIGLASGLAVAAAGTWLLLRRRSRG